MQPAEQQRRRDDQLAPRVRVRARGRALCLVDLLEDLPARRDVVAARVGERELARRAREQARLEMGFEVRELAAHGSEGDLQPAPGAGQAAGVYDGNKDAHGVEAVHLFHFPE